MCYYPNYRENAKGLVNSIKKFYPDIPVFEYIEMSKPFDLKDFCDWHLDMGYKLLDEYKRVISMDPDEIMCNKCPDLFGDFDLGVVQNNIPMNTTFDNWTRGMVYINAGLTVCTNKEVWKEWMDEYQKRCEKFPGEGLNEQNALNEVFHNSKFKVDLLEFHDKVYGISAMDYGYPNMYLGPGGLRVRWSNSATTIDKKLCVFHAAGLEWKVKATGEYNFDLIHDVQAREYLKGLIC
jgi:hypothetical protein